VVTHVGLITSQYINPSSGYSLDLDGRNSSHVGNFQVVELLKTSVLFFTVLLTNSNFSHTASNTSIQSGVVVALRSWYNVDAVFSASVNVLSK